MTNLLANAESSALKAYLRTILGKVVVGAKTIRIVGSKDILASAVMAKDASRNNVRSFVPQWRARKDSNLRPSESKSDALSS